MNPKQFELLETRLITQVIQYNGRGEPPAVKEKNDREFCEAFFNQNNIDIKTIENLLTESIQSQNNFELDLLLMLLEHFEIVSHFVPIFAPQLIQPWHTFHDRIARLLMEEKKPETTRLLYQGATYCCENLDYQSDYNEFNKKCIHGLYNIGTTEAKNCLEELCKNENKNISAAAEKLFSRLS